MNQKEKLLLAADQINNILKLTEDNQWKGFFQSQLIPAYYEIQRQLSVIDARKETV
jgi:hypothetical protein